MIKIYDNVEAERDRIQSCIGKYGWTSDHNLDWFIDAGTGDGFYPAFIEFEDGAGILVSKGEQEWRIWSDPLSDKKSAPDKILEFADYVLSKGTAKVWCDDVSDTIRPVLLNKTSRVSVGDVYYSLFWPVLNMISYDPNLPGGNFKEMRNAKSKFYREHKVEMYNPAQIKQEILFKIVHDWKEKVSLKQEAEDVMYQKYINAIQNNFRAFVTARVMVVDGKPIGFNAGYEVINFPGRFAGIIGIHNYSLNDLGIILWLEDLEWIKNSGYKELDMQGSEDNDGGLKLKLSFGAQIERKTDTFPLILKLDI